MGQYLLSWYIIPEKLNKLIFIVKHWRINVKLMLLVEVFSQFFRINVTLRIWTCVISIIVSIFISYLEFNLSFRLSSFLKIVFSFSGVGWWRWYLQQQFFFKFYICYLCSWHFLWYKYCINLLIIEWEKIVWLYTISPKIYE